ncbi:hypothetical protein [Leifsonia sp. NPDC058230]|uniref:hypothetical protein n=1 Tax=Leifsonia sp. NPDC058230 TaxID=3346391 RepID=UPI0036DD0F5D
MGEQQGHVREQNSKRTRALIIWSVIVASVLVIGAGTVLVVTVSGWLHAAFSNPADAQIQPFNAALDELGGRKLCTNGDGGNGPDNLIPWSTVYYLVPHAGGISDSLRQTAVAEGYSLKPMAFESDPSPVPDEALNADDRLQIYVYRDADVPLYCSDIVRYGETRQVSGEDVIVEVSVELPSRLLD